MRNATDSYLDQIGSIPLMTPEEEIHLGTLVQRMQKLIKEDRKLSKAERREVVAGERAKARFIQANLRLCVYIVKRNRMRFSFLENLDLVQEATLGLVRAVEMFDPSRGYKFSTYAYWWIRQSIYRANHTQERAIRRPASVGELAFKIDKLFQSEMIRLGRAPTLDELAEAAGCKRSELELLATRGTYCCSLDVPAGGHYEDGRSSKLDLLPDDRQMDAEELYESLDNLTYLERLKDALDSLTDQERTIVVQRFGLDGGVPKTFLDIAKSTTVSRESVRQIAERGLKKIRNYVRDPDGCAFRGLHSDLIEALAA